MTQLEKSLTKLEFQFRDSTNKVEDVLSDIETDNEPISAQVHQNYDISSQDN
jgi:hypothetical protein